jgi:hypothetical protein
MTKPLIAWIASLAWVVTLGVFAWIPSAAAQLSLVVEVGDAGPDGGGEQYKIVRRPDPGDGGAAAYRARMKGGVDNRGVYTATTTPGASVALRDSIVPSGGFYRRFSRPSTNASGDVAYDARTPGGSGRGVYCQPDSTCFEDTVVLKSGTNTGSAGGEFSKFCKPAMTDSEGVAFHATLSGGSESEGLFRCSSGNGNCASGTGILEQLVVVGDLFDGGTREVCEISHNFTASDYGIAFRAKTGSVGCGGGTQDGVLRMDYASDTIVQLALAGDTADTGSGSSSYSRFDGPPAINNSGDVAFLAETVTPLDIVYRCEIGTCPAAIAEAFVVQGDSIGGSTFVSRFRAVGISDAADVSFQAIGDGISTRGLGVYVRRDSLAFETAAFKNDPATGDRVFRRVRLPSMSPSGYVAFRAKTKLTTDGTSAYGVFVYN